MKIKFIGTDLDIALIYILYIHLIYIWIFDVEEHVNVLVFYDNKKMQFQIIIFLHFLYNRFM